MITSTCADDRVQIPYEHNVARWLIALLFAQNANFLYNTKPFRGFEAHRRYPVLQVLVGSGLAVLASFMDIPLLFFLVLAAGCVFLFMATAGMFLFQLIVCGSVNTADRSENCGHFLAQPVILLFVIGAVFCMSCGCEQSCL